MASKLRGDWGRLRRINRLTKPLFEQPEVKAQITIIANEILTKVITNILGDKLPLEPHAASYMNRSSTGTILYDTGEWVENLEVKDVRVQQNGLVIFIGGASDKIHYNADTGEALSMEDLTKWIEFGTIKQPPRPVFLLTWESVKDKYKKKILKILQTEVNKAL